MDAENVFNAHHWTLAILFLFLVIFTAFFTVHSSIQNVFH